MLFYAIKSRSKNGTTTFNRLITVHCVTAGQMLTLGVGIVRSGDDPEDAVARLLDWCTRHGIMISSLTMDRGFHSAAVINAVKKRGVPMVMPAVKNERILRIIRRYDSEGGANVLEHTITSSVSKESASYTLIIFRRNEKETKSDPLSQALYDLYKKEADEKDDVGKKYHVFATTMDGAWMHGEPYVIAQFYKRRWGIENSYKCYEQIRPRTTGTRYPVRILWWFLPFVLYNAWILGRFMACRRTDIPGGRPTATLGDFMTHMHQAASSRPEPEQADRPPD